MSKDLTYIAKTNFRRGEVVFGIKRADRLQHMYIIGKTGSGKTAFVTNICYRLANKGIKVAMFALEDRLEDYGIRAVFFELGRVRKKAGLLPYGWSKYRRNELTGTEYRRFRKEAADKIKNTNLSFVKAKGQVSIDLLEKEKITTEQASIMMARDIELLEADIAKAQGEVSVIGFSS